MTSDLAWILHQDWFDWLNLIDWQLDLEDKNFIYEEFLLMETKILFVWAIGINLGFYFCHSTATKSF